MAALSRAVAGTRGMVLIVNLPGSPKGAVESLDAIVELVPHVLDLPARAHPAPGRGTRLIFCNVRNVMPHFRLMAAGLAAAALLAQNQQESSQPAQPSQPESPLFRTQVENVVAPVTVLDHDGNYVDGLPAAAIPPLRQR